MPQLVTTYVAACALYNEHGEVLVQQRPPGAFMEGYWEFPGGKIEAGESPRVAACREMMEELTIELDADNLTPITFMTADYPARNRHAVVMLFGGLYTGAVNPRENQQYVWTCGQSLPSFADFLPANRPLAEAVGLYLAKVAQKPLKTPADSRTIRP